jgi:hypothetical protein
MSWEKNAIGTTDFWKVDVRMKKVRDRRTKSGLYTPTACAEIHKEQSSLSSAVALASTALY